MERYFASYDIVNSIKSLTNHRVAYCYKPQRVILINSITED